ncbi:MAG TPA: hypothetical protein VGD91_08245 [Trebonia sp.]
MNRVIVVAATLATAAMATLATVATNTPALAAARPVTASPAAGPAAPARTLTLAKPGTVRAGLATGQAAVSGPASATVASLFDNGKYVTVVHCTGKGAPPPIRLGQPGTPLTASGTGPSAGILAMLKKPNPYKTVYQCTVTVERKTVAKPKKAAPACELTAGRGGRAGKCIKPVSLSTGFGGEASKVAGHHPGTTPGTDPAS